MISSFLVKCDHDHSKISGICPFKKIFINFFYLTALDLSCSMWDLLKKLT